MNIIRLHTMVQKLSKCEVKAWLCWNLIILLHSDFTWNSILGNSNGPKMSFFGNLKDSELKILENLGLESCSNLLKSKFRASKFVKNDIFGPFEITKIWFHVKSEWQYNDQISTKLSLHFTFWKFLEHSATVYDYM